MGADVRPNQLVLRCYGYRTRSGRWYGVCVDLNIAVEASSIEELRSKMGEALQSYLEAVLATEDRSSVPGLLSRKAPVGDWLRYYLIKLLLLIKKFPDNFIFREYIPFHLSHAC